MILGGFVLALLGWVIILEAKHYFQFGHLVSYGWHTDLLYRKVDIGIPGIERMYRVRLANYTWLPAIFDEIQHPLGYPFDGRIDYAYRVERWDSGSHGWVKIVELDFKGYRAISRIVWPGSSIEVGDEATAARDGFKKGDMARFIIFKQINRPEGSTGQGAFYSPPFRIEEEPRERFPARVR